MGDCFVCGNPADAEVHRDAIFSPCRSWRYTLLRHLRVDPAPPVPRRVLFVCLNPSTATEVEDDPTVRRCMGFARAWGFNRLTVCNIFAVRSTDPKVLYDHPDPVGPENDYYIQHAANGAEMIVAAWGNHGKLHRRGEEVMALLRGDDGLLEGKRAVHVLGLNLGSFPKHPLYLRADLQPQQLCP